MKCPVCGRKVDSLKTAIKNGVYISERCESCLANFTTSSTYARKYERDRQREDYRKDIIQRFEGDKINPEFVRAYEKQSRQEFGDEVVRDYGVKRKQY